MKTEIKIPVEQGDVTLIDANIPERLLKESPKRKSQNGRTILAIGESTGHIHSLDSRSSYVVDVTPELRTLFNKQMAISTAANILDGVLVVEKPDALKHGTLQGITGDHNPIDIKPGVRWIVIEQEYTPRSIVRVSD